MSHRLHRSPKFARGFLYSARDEGSPKETTYSFTESASPLPAVPPKELTRPGADTIRRKDLADHFRIVSPIDVRALEFLTRQHPNRRFVVSILRGFYEGFWPYADTDAVNKNGERYPDTWDGHRRKLDDDQATFVRNYRDEEVAARRYSRGFDLPILAPGMYSQPVYAVPKPDSTKLRLINDMKVGKFPPNGMVIHDTKEQTVVMDNMQDFGKLLLTARHLLGSSFPIRLFKSDVAHAFRNIPVHPLWQLKQIVTIDGERYVDRCLNFGLRSAPRVFGAFMGLVMWIAVNVERIYEIRSYVDDVFGLDLSEHLVYYPPYKKMFPPSQVALLRLWDRLRIPHEEKKQLHGTELTIIGFYVDARRMTLSLPPDRKDALLKALSVFICGKGVSFQALVEWQRLAGWIAWAVNVIPTLRPLLTSIFERIHGKTNENEPILVDKEAIDDLLRILYRVQRHSGLLLPESVHWQPYEADMTLYCDASPIGLGFWSPSLGIAYACPTPERTVPEAKNIFYQEALCVASAVHWAAEQRRPPRRLAIYTDSLNTVQIFSSYTAKGAYNMVLRCAVEICEKARIDLRVYQVPGIDNTVADALSREKWDDATRFASRKIRSLSIGPLIVPPAALKPPWRRRTEASSEDRERGKE